MIMIWMVTGGTCWRLIHVKWQLQQSGGQNVCPTNQELQAALIMVSMLLLGMLFPKTDYLGVLLNKPLSRRMSNQH